MVAEEDDRLQTDSGQSTVGRFREFCGNTWTLVIGLLGILVLVYVSFQLFSGQKIIIDNFAVDNAGQKYDDLSSILPMRIVSQIFKFPDLSERQRARIGARYGETALDITVKSVTFSVSAVIDLLRSNVLSLDTHIHGYISVHDRDLILTIWGERGGKTFLEYTTQPMSDADLLAKDVAERIVRVFDPFTFAASTFAQEQSVSDTQHKGSLAVISALLDKTGRSNSVGAGIRLSSEENAWLLNLWGLILFDQRNYTAALSKFETVIDEDPDPISPYPEWVLKIFFPNAKIVRIAYANRGDTLRKLGKLTDAIESYRKSEIWSSSIPNLRWARPDLDTADSSDPDLDTADSSHAVPSDLGNRIVDATKSMENDPKNPDLLFYRGRLRLLAGDVSGAESDFREGNRLMTGRDVDWLLTEGAFCNRNGHPELVIKLLSSPPPNGWPSDDVEVWYQLSIAYSALGKTQLAFDAAVRAIDLLNPDQRIGRY